MGKNKKNRNRNNIEYIEKDYSMYYLWIIRVGIITCLFLPLLIVRSHMYAMQVGKVLAFRTIIEIIAFFYIILIIKKPEYRPKWGLFELVVTLFILLYLFTSLTGMNFFRSFWGTAERMGGFFTLMHLWAYFIILISVFKMKKERKLLFGSSIFVAIISLLYAIGQRYSYDIVYYFNSIGYKNITNDFFVNPNTSRPFGTLGNAGLFAGYVLYNLFFGLYLFGTSKKISGKLVSAIPPVALIGAVVISGTRSALLAAVGGLLSMSISTVFMARKKKIKIISSLFILTLVVSSIYAWENKDEKWVKNNVILSRFANISFETGETRTMTWGSSWSGFMERPVLGVGPENYNIVFNKYFNPLHFTGYGAVSWYDKAHNIFLDILTTMGVIGLISYLGVFAVIYWFLARNKHKARENLPAFALIASFPIAYFVQNMFWFDDFSTYLMLFLFFAFVSNFFNEDLKFEYNVEAGKIIINKILDIVRLRRISLRLKYWISDNKNAIIASVGIFLILTIYYTNIKAWKFHDLTTIAVGAFSLNADDSFLWYREAMGNSTYLGRQELYKRFGNYVNVKYVLSGRESPKEKEIFKQNMKFAISEMEKAVAENKEDVQFYSLLGAFYNKYYSNFREAEYIEKAEKTLQEAVELSPERETVYYEYGQTMIFKKDYEKAVELFKKGVDLNPPVPVSHWYLGMAYLNAKKYSLADAEINEAIKLGYNYNTVKDLLNIAPIYIELKDYSKLKELYSKVSILDPENPEIYVSLALVYKELGDKMSAIEMAKKAISIDESFRVEGERFIKELESSI